MLSNIEIARAATPKPIVEVARGLGIADEAVYNYGPYKAKIDLRWLDRLRAARRPAGAGLRDHPDAGRRGQDHDLGRPGDGLRRLGKNAVLCLREPSLGPCFGVKGGAPAAATRR